MFSSKFEKLGNIEFPSEKGETNILMMPIIIGDLSSIPKTLNKWKPTLSQLFENVDQNDLGKVGYLTIDERFVSKRETHRTKGIHVDGVFKNSLNYPESFAGSHGGGHGGHSTDIQNKGGFYLASNVVGCRAWNQDYIEGYQGPTGECEHLENFLNSENEETLEINTVYWMDRLCVHESIPMLQDCHRQLIRLSSPNSYPWFTHFTSNSLGVQAEGEIVDKEIYFQTKTTSKVLEPVN